MTRQQNPHATFVSLLLTLSLLATANTHSAELFSAVDSTTYQRLAVENRSSLAKYAHLSKRLRLVTINTEVLLGDQKEFSISPFSDVSIPVSRTDLRMSDSKSSFQWTGRYLNAPLSRDAFLNLQRSRDVEPEYAKRLYATLFELQISGAKYIYDEEAGESREASAVYPDPVTGRYDHRKLLSRSTGASAGYFEIVLDVKPPLPEGETNDDGAPFSAIYAVRSLPSDRRYHIVYEVDPAKSVPVGPVDAINNPDAARRLEEYRNLEKALENSSQ